MVLIRFCGQPFLAYGPNKVLFYFPKFPPPHLTFVSWIPQSSSVRYQHLGSAWAAIRSNTPPEVRTWHYLLYRACRKKGSVCSGPSRRPGLVSCLLFSALHMWLALRPRVSLCPFPPWLLIRQSILGGTCLSPCAWWGRCGYSMYCTKPNRLVSREPKTDVCLEGSDLSIPTWKSMV